MVKKQKSTWKPQSMLNWPMTRPFEQSQSVSRFTFTLTQKEREMRSDE